DTARAAAGGGRVLDARAHDRFRGDHEPIDPRPGHIPGAHSAPFARNLDQATGCFLPAADLRRRYDELGARPGAEVIVYCGSGVSACHDLLALEAIGVTARLYPGSWSQWSADPARPAALGDH
ncbi:MAG: sulfurtransferase, partial [Acidimicrobiales bacterium]